MAEDQQLSSQVAGILSDYILLDVAEENRKLKEEFLRLQPSRALLGRIEFCLDSGDVITTSMSKCAIIIENNYLLARIDCDTPLPLGGFIKGRLGISGQWLYAGEEVSVRAFEFDTKFGFLDVSIHFKGIFLKGKVCGLSNDDFICLRDGEDSLKHLLERTADPNSITFSLNSMSMVITPELEETIRMFGPHTTFTSVQRLKNLLPEHIMTPTDPPLSQSEKSHRDLLAGLGCTTSQLGLLEENQHLKRELFGLKMIEDRLKTVEISHPQGEFKLMLDQGFLKEIKGESFWIILVERGTPLSRVNMNDFLSLGCCVSGVSLENEELIFQTNDQINVGMKFHNDATVFGKAEMVTLREFTVLMTHGGTSFLELNVDSILFPIDCVKSTLIALGVDIFVNDGDDV
eukprot:CAMPEP_0183714542 /NCGR_PEP_ID=MMETSP0737-20130205/9031_1 /TAXON_ID=385413 /ORGANISM="Thalassiosira miniscula, Strain CCMP1093" /LENGTH=402 /DNA_ID=CAMNT_0025943485 /DNA_START=781 /DNA_END=1989 /DNA_ORIENTATION=+